MNRFDQANKEEEEKRKILSMWNAAEKLSSKADNAFCNWGGDATPHAKEAWSDGSPPSLVQLPVPSEASNKYVDAVSLSANVVTAADDMELEFSRGDLGKGETEAVMVKAVQPLEQDGQNLQTDE